MLDRPPEALDGVAHRLLVRIVEPGGFLAERVTMREIAGGIAALGHDAILAHEDGRIPADLRYAAGEWRDVGFAAWAGRAAWTTPVAWRGSRTERHRGAIEAPLTS
jgi:hypothetical protein